MAKILEKQHPYI